MSNTVEICRTVKVFTFRGDRGPFAAAFVTALDEAANRGGPDVSGLDCLPFAGHAGVSTDLGTTIYGFNPDGGGIPNWQLIDQLQRRIAYPGTVRNDTSMFVAATARGFTVLSFNIILPATQFQDFERRIEDERSKSQFSYGFPDGDGDCNCVSWLERLGLPLLTGRMDEFVLVYGVANQRKRRFGLCV